MRVPSTAASVLLTQAELDLLLDELDALRSAHRNDLAQRLRQARGVGVSGDNDDHLAAFEDAVVDNIKIMRLERLIASATVIDGAVASAGAAGLGSVVHVADGAGGRAEYELVGVRTVNASRRQVTPGSPMGQALFGACAGDTVTMTLPNGRERSLTVLTVITAGEAATAIAQRVRRSASR
jgi:transcription elongation factor GreA